MSDCIHNARSRYTHGFYCRDCATFFEKSSAVYRKEELVKSIYMVLNNINAPLLREGRAGHKDVADMKEEIGIGKTHENYEDIIFRAEKIMSKHGMCADSAKITLK